MHGNENLTSECRTSLTVRLISRPVRVHAIIYFHIEFSIQLDFYSLINLLAMLRKMIGVPVSNSCYLSPYFKMKLYIQYWWSWLATESFFRLQHMMISLLMSLLTDFMLLFCFDFQPIITVGAVSERFSGKHNEFN